MLDVEPSGQRGHTGNGRNWRETYRFAANGATPIWTCEAALRRTALSSAVNAV